MSAPSPAVAVSLPRRFGYALGGVAEGVKSTGFDLFVLFYYNQLLGVSGSLCGIALAFSLIVEGVVNPLVGSFSDSLRSRFGRRHPFMIAAAIPFGLCFWLLLSPPDLGEGGLFVWLAVFAMLSRTLLTVFQVPYLALGAELATDSIGRTQMYAWRQVAEGAGMFGASLLAFGLFFTELQGGRSNPDSYASFGATVGGIGAAFMLLAAWCTRSAIATLPGPGPMQRISIRSIVRDMRSALSNRSFQVLMGFALLTYVAIGLANSYNLYIYEFFWGLNSTDLLSINSAWPIGILVGAALTTTLHRFLEKRTVLVIGAAGWALGQLVPVSLRYFELLPMGGGADIAWFLTIVKFAQGLFIAQALVSIGSMIGDIADEQALIRAERQEGVFFGFFQFFKRVNGGIGGLIAGAGLDLIAWPAGQAGPEAERNVNGLAFFYGPVTTALAVMGMALLIFYRLNRSRAAAIHAEVQRRQV